MITANLVVKDCYNAKIELLSMTEDELKYRILDAVPCYDCQTVLMDGIKTLTPKDSYTLSNIQENGDDSVIYNLIVMLADEQGQEDLLDESFIDYICREAALSKDRYYSIVTPDGSDYDPDPRTPEDRIPKDEIICAMEDLEPDGELDEEDLDNQALIARAVEIYKKNLEQAAIDEESDNPRIWLYADDKVTCAKNAVKAAVKEMKN